MNEVALVWTWSSFWLWAQSQSGRILSLGHNSLIILFFFRVCLGIVLFIRGYMQHNESESCSDILHLKLQKSSLCCHLCASLKGKLLKAKWNELDFFLCSLFNTRISWNFSILNQFKCKILKRLSRKRGCFLANYARVIWGATERTWLIGQPATSLSWCFCLLAYINLLHSSIYIQQITIVSSKGLPISLNIKYTWRWELNNMEIHGILHNCCCDYIKVLVTAIQCKMKTLFWAQTIL